MKKLENKIAVVTGGSSGIGLATAKELIVQGAKVIITGRNKEALESTAKAIGAIGSVSDQSNLAHIDKLVAKTESLYGKVDILVINAAIGLFAPIGQINEEHFNTVMDINFKGAFFTFQSFLRLLKAGSSVTFVSSSIAYTGSPNSAIYNASKAALNSITRTAAYELASQGIRVNVVCPGVVDTPILGKVGLAKDTISQFKKGMAQKVPLKRFGSPEEIANLIAFLSSDDASYITGSEYIADGGLNLNPLIP